MPVEHGLPLPCENDSLNFTIRGAAAISPPRRPMPPPGIPIYNVEAGSQTDIFLRTQNSAFIQFLGQGEASNRHQRAELEATIHHQRAELVAKGRHQAETEKNHAEHTKQQNLDLKSQRAINVSLRQQLDQTVKGARATQTRLGDDARRLKQESKAATETHQAREKALETRCADTDSLRQEISQVKTDAHATRTRLEDDIHLLKQEKKEATETFQARVKDLEESLQELEADLAMERGAIKDLQSRADEAEVATEAAIVERDNAMNTSDNLAAKLEREQKVSKGQREAHTAELVEERNIVTGLRGEVRMTREHGQRKVDTLQAQVDADGVDLSDLRKAKETADKIEAQFRIDLDTRGQQLSAAKKEVSRLETEVETHKDQAAEWTMELSDRDRTLGEEREVKIALQARTDKLMLQNNELISTSKQQAAEITTLRKRNTAAENFFQSGFKMWNDEKEEVKEPYTPVRPDNELHPVVGIATPEAKSSELLSDDAVKISAAGCPQIVTHQQALLEPQQRTSIPTCDVVDSCKINGHTARLTPDGEGRITTGSEVALADSDDSAAATTPGLTPPPTLSGRSPKPHICIAIPPAPAPPLAPTPQRMEADDLPPFQKRSKPQSPEVVVPVNRQSGSEQEKRKRTDDAAGHEQTQSKRHAGPPPIRSRPQQDRRRPPSRSWFCR